MSFSLLVRRILERLPLGVCSLSLARVIVKWLAEREREAMRQLIVEGCTEMRTEYERTDREWEGAADEVWLNV